jgi:hypothetical protein
VLLVHVDVAVLQAGVQGLEIVDPLVVARSELVVPGDQ